MKTSKKIFFLFLVLGALYVIGFILDISVLTTVTTFLMVPVLILYYRYKVKKWFLPMVFVLLFFYVRDLLMLNDLFSNITIMLWCFSGAILLLYTFALTSFNWSSIQFLESLSLLIMYAFLGFLYYTLAELVPEVISSHREIAYIYILSLILLLAITFSQYIVKSHYASLWLMLASASLLLSELSLFFKLFILPDISVTIFFPLFHAIALFAMVEHAVHRRKSSNLPGF